MNLSRRRLYAQFRLKEVEVKEVEVKEEELKEVEAKEVEVKEVELKEEEMKEEETTTVLFAFALVFCHKIDLLSYLIQFSLVPFGQLPRRGLWPMSCL